MILRILVIFALIGVIQVFSSILKFLFELFIEAEEKGKKIEFASVVVSILSLALSIIAILIALR